MSVNQVLKNEKQQDGVGIIKAVPELRYYQVMNPYASALSDYLLGDHDAHFVIERDDGYRQVVPAKVFCDDSCFAPLEQEGLNLCRGKVLDVGAGAGRHSLELIRNDFRVSAIDISEECSRIQQERGLVNVITADVLVWKDKSFDTILMLMNGIGMVRDLDGLRRFLEHAHEITNRGGQILCDSIDVTQTEDPVHIAYWKRNEERGIYSGQQRFVMCRRGEREEFNWVHVDFANLSQIAEDLGWGADKVYSGSNGHYLARLEKLS